MRRIRTSPLTNITISRFQRMVPVVELNPPYQREGGIWKPYARGKLIDSILNGLDIPKLYFEGSKTGRVNESGLTYQYSVIDGKQRLESIIGFLSGSVSLPDDFIYFEDESVLAQRMTFFELESTYPQLIRRLFDYELPIVRVTTDSGDLIEEMFQRLNASTALNAAEKRNALSGSTKDAANELADHHLLTARSPIKNARYKYRELGAKFLAIEQQLDERGKVVDTKARTLYELFVATHETPPRISREAMDSYKVRATHVLDGMAEVFTDNDPLLASIGTVVVYYLVFREVNGTAISRDRLIEFEEKRREISGLEDESLESSRPAYGRLREYNAYVQSTNDGRALRRRAEILSIYLVSESQEGSLQNLDRIEDGEAPSNDDEDPSED